MKVVTARRLSCSAQGVNRGSEDPPVICRSSIPNRCSSISIADHLFRELSRRWPAGLNRSRPGPIVASTPCGTSGRATIEPTGCRSGTISAGWEFFGLTARGDATTC